MSHQIGAMPRLRTSVVDKVLLEAISSGLKSNKKVIQTRPAANKISKKKTDNSQQIPTKLKREINDALRASNLEVKHESKGGQLIVVGPSESNGFDLS